MTDTVTKKVYRVTVAIVREESAYLEAESEAEARANAERIMLHANIAIVPEFGNPSVEERIVSVEPYADDIEECTGDERMSVEENNEFLDEAISAEEV